MVLIIGADNLKKSDNRLETPTPHLLTQVSSCRICSVALKSKA